MKVSKTKALKGMHHNCYVSLIESEYIYDEIIKMPDTGRLLELGTGLGHSTCLFSRTKPNWTIYTVDAYGSAGTPPLIFTKEKLELSNSGVKEVKTYLDNNGRGNVIQIVSSFNDLAWELPVDILFIDGSHWYKDIKEDWEKFTPFVKDDGLVIMHDYNRNFGVQDFIEKEVVPTGKWKIWNKQCIGFAKRQ